MLATPAQTLRNGLIALNIPLEEPLQMRLLGYLALLKKWNKTYSLTAITDDAHMVTHHLLDCAAIFPHLSQTRTVLDVGSGGGMPGIPLAIAFPHIAVTLIDSNNKKTRFLEQAKIELQLPNVTVVHARVEDWQADTTNNSSHAQLFDCITSRAFADLALFWQLSKHLLAKNGYFAAMKGPRAEAESLALPADCAPPIFTSLAVPGMDGERTLVRLTRAEPR
jgi:16S rRNA (guanine527-N7)-methyltransferase